MSISLVNPEAPPSAPPIVALLSETAPLAASGKLEVRLAGSPDELTACQKLRYRVFFEEMDARPSPEEAREGRDFDQFDGVCDHLMVIDRSGPDRVVGTYRLLRREVAEANGGYYTAGEYDLTPFSSDANRDANYLELGRSCVHADFRTKPVIDLLWKGIGAYVERHAIDVMFGCASFPGRDPQEHALALAHLYRAHLAPESWRACALPARYVAMDPDPGAPVDKRRAFRALPPIIRGYIRAGAYVGDGAVIDHEFGTVDVLIVFPVAQIAERYVGRFGGSRS